MEKLLEKIIEDCHFNSDKFDALCEYESYKQLEKLT